MSIAPLVRVELIGAAADRGRLLEALQALGSVHLDVLDGSGPDAPDAELRAACAWLAAAPQQRHPAPEPPDFDGPALVAAALALKDRRRALDEERASLRARIADVAPWGRWTFRDLTANPELRLWFYKVPGPGLARLDGLVWHEIRRVGGEHWVVVIAAEEPALPLPRVHIGARSLPDLEARLAEVEIALDDVEAARTDLTRWRAALERRRDLLADAAARAAVAERIAGDEALFRLSGWAAEADVAALTGWAEAQGAALLLRSPAAEEAPPTLLANPPRWAAGEALTRFFTTPDYRAWDPSPLVAAGFVAFFALIVSDALYGLALLVLLGLAWPRLGRSAGGRQTRRIGLALALATLGWGVITGIYGGGPPPADWLARARLVPGDDLQTMLRLSIAIGLAHLTLANAIAARRLWPAALAWGRLGWIAVFVAAGLAFGWPGLRGLAAGIGGMGLVLVLLGSSAKRDWRGRLLDGGAQLARLVSALGDTMSYLRLFALALAGSALAAAFNALAHDAFTVPGAGAVLGLLVLVFGHMLNLALSVASGVVHGLRLNYIEFFGWGLWGEGRPFRPFRQAAGDGR